MDKVILEAKGLIKSYVNGNNKLKVLDGIDIKLEEGKIVTIMGKSGSGKSTPVSYTHLTLPTKA